MGVLIIAVGILFTLENLGLVDARDYFRFWPAGLMAVGLLKLWHGRGGAVFGGFVFVFAGTWLLLQLLGIVSISLWSLWPVLLVVAGATIVWKGMNGPGTDRGTGDVHSTVSAIAVLAGINRGNTSKTFRGGDLTAILGGCEIDLRQASIEGEAVIDVFAMWGG